MRVIIALSIAAAALSGCVAEVGEEEVSAQGEELYVFPGLNADGDACCAKDYRDGDGDTVVCGTRDGEWCCNEDRSDCASCNWYECEPPPQKAIFTPVTLYRSP